jgi:hypothetical protein
MSRWGVGDEGPVALLNASVPTEPVASVTPTMSVTGYMAMLVARFG